MSHLSALNPHCADNHSECNTDSSYRENNKHICKHDADHNHLWIKHTGSSNYLLFPRAKYDEGWEPTGPIIIFRWMDILERRAPGLWLFSNCYIISSPTLTCEFKRKKQNKTKKKKKQPLAAALQSREPSISRHMCSNLKSGRENLWTSTSHHNEYHRHSNQTQWAKKAQRGSEGRERKPHSLKRYLPQKKTVLFFFKHTKRLKAESNWVNPTQMFPKFTVLWFKPVTGTLMVVFPSLRGHRAQTLPSYTRLTITLTRACNPTCILSPKGKRVPTIKICVPTSQVIHVHTHTNSWPHSAPTVVSPETRSDRCTARGNRWPLQLVWHRWFRKQHQGSWTLIK